MTYEQDLCLKLLSYAALSSPFTEDMKASEINAAASVFFGEEIVEFAIKIMTGSMPDKITAKDSVGR